MTLLQLVSIMRNFIQIDLRRQFLVPLVPTLQELRKRRMLELLKVLMQKQLALELLWDYRLDDVSLIFLVSLLELMELRDGQLVLQEIK